jgi:hypothetical protein
MMSGERVASGWTPLRRPTRPRIGPWPLLHRPSEFLDLGHQIPATFLPLFILLTDLKNEIAPNRTEQLAQALC